ncbi:uncharacterized protein [Spinacia oleracea]|uniref:CCHC-type domain-containing protein n=1 Tax=Spinacia oleracea TaxID=3562 RepID=A0ABM3QNX7_SPIOL|nr:uncharacterized protein LOC110774844 [Spinacia oleracea]
MAFNESNVVERSNPPEANVAHRGGRGGYNHRGRGRGNHRGRGRGHGRGRGYLAPRNNNHKGHQQGNQKQTPSKEKDTCFRCGMIGHWGKTCRTAKHLVDLYQASIKGKGKVAEANYVNEENSSVPSFDVSDFFVDNPDNGNDLIFGNNSNI